MWKLERVSLVRIACKLLVGNIFHRLSSTRNRCVRENQADFLPGHGFIDQIFTFRCILA